MTSGLRLDEILADYFTHKEEKSKEKSRSKEDSESHRKRGHHKHKHKKKYKKHKRSKDSEGEGRSSRKRRSHSTEHKGQHKDNKKTDKETVQGQDLAKAVHERAPEKGLTDEKGLTEKGDSSQCTDKKKELVSDVSKNEADDKANNTDSNASSSAVKQDTVDTETVSCSSKVPDVSDSIEEGEIVNDTTDNSKEVSVESSSHHKRKSKKKRKHEDRSRSSSPGRKHSKSSGSHKHRHHHHHQQHLRKSRSRSRSRDKKDLRSSHEGSHSSSRQQQKSRSRSRERKPPTQLTKPVKDLRERIDKRRLLEIARKNVLEMIENGTLPQGMPVASLQPQQLVSIKAGGKSVQELTEFCKALAEKHKDYRSSSSDDERHGPPTSDEEDTPFLHHPFKVKEVQPVIRMNIRNAVQLPVRTTAEKTADAVKLRQQFPVSSGNQHRTKELEWVPVEKSDAKPPPAAAATAPAKKAWGTTATPKPTPVTTPAVLAETAPTPPPPPVIAPQPAAPPEPKAAPQAVVQPADVVFPSVPSPEVDIGTIMAERLHAMRKLQENPHDVQALGQMYNAQQQMQNWAQSKIQPGQFGHSVTNRLLTPEELTGPYPVWARKLTKGRWRHREGAECTARRG